MNVTQVVTIGRNIGDTPMPLHEWRRFKLAVLSALLATNGNVIQRPFIESEGDQAGSWEGHVTEDAATFIALTPEAYAFTVRCKLKSIASRFQQEAIGFIVLAGTEHLIRTTAAERAEFCEPALLPYGATTADGFVVGV